MLKNKKILITLGLLLLSLSVYAQPISVNSLRYWTAPDHTRMVFDVTNTATHQIFLIDKPARLVIDFHNAKLKSLLKQPPKDHPLFSRVRSATHNKKGLRVVVDLKAEVNPKSFSLNPNKTYGHRLVIDLYDKTSKSNKYSAKAVDSSKQVTKSVTSKARDIVIAIDPGHGGEDPGAHGPRGTKEKKVVFDISKRLAALINKKPGMKAVLVRKGDYYIKLRKRMEIARAAKAQLFVSIHADAFKNPKVKGASVFTVSKRGASSEAARWLAQHENAADLVGGVKLADKEDMVATVLMDLSQKNTKEVSRNIAGRVLRNFKNIGHLHSQNVQKAGFMVLKSPDIPSILVETAFISNPDEERKLRSAKHQQKMARAIFKGVVDYFKQYPPPNTYFALNNANKHIISRGETLSGIADQYGVSMRSIKIANALASNKIQIGQVLKIPRG
ncbi:MAG: AMIN domain-containing protein [Methylococcales symbiont of Iophon sp. n. MRB-2018]|nr:MAG: AMIN domain-containing protein [Methylococcales symbiont of Iophon sp. n. MRB-2018]KAF3979604.1 MAG: AMIN domain-containing protein [Methylococcales symbiont of Iophon sp. n. MRB-2018]